MSNRTSLGAVHRSSSRRTATSLSRSAAARVPGSHGSDQHAAAGDGRVDQGVGLRREGDVGDAVGALAAKEEQVARAAWRRARPPRRSPPAARRHAAAPGPARRRWSAPDPSSPRPRASPLPTRTARPRSAPAPTARRACARAAAVASATGGTSPSTTSARRPSGRRTLPPSSAPRARSGRRSRCPATPSVAPRLHPRLRAATGRPPPHRSRPGSPRGPSPGTRRGRRGPGATRRAVQHAPGLAQHELAHLLGAEAGLGEERGDRGADDDGGHGQRGGESGMGNAVRATVGVRGRQPPARCRGARPPRMPCTA